MDDACKRHGRVRCDECAEMGGLRARLAEANAEVKRLTTAWRAIDRANVSLRERLAAAQTRNVCPECGLTPGAISTCYCEECVGEIKEKLAAAEAAAHFYARWYDGPAEALLGEEDRKAFMWIEENGCES